MVCGFDWFPCNCLYLFVFCGFVALDFWCFWILRFACLFSWCFLLLSWLLLAAVCLAVYYIGELCVSVTLWVWCDTGNTAFVAVGCVLWYFVVFVVSGVCGFPGVSGAFDGVFGVLI